MFSFILSLFPLYSTLVSGDATTTICHRNTPPDQLRHFIKSADILVTATGIPGLVTADMVKDGVVVIDVGITRILDKNGKARLVGDVDFAGNICKKFFAFSSMGINTCHPGFVLVALKQQKD